MNIQVQICGIVILLVLIVFYKSNRTLKLYTEKIFFRSMLFATVSLCLDVLSLVVIAYRESLPDFFVRFVCKTYVISLIWVGVSALIYVLTDILPEQLHRKRTKQYVWVTSVQGLLVYVLPISIYENGTEVYTYGPAVLCVYVFALLYVIATIVILCAFHNRVNRRRRFAVGLWMTIWIIAAVIQFLNNELLLVGFATAIGILILLAIMENPESNLDRRLGCFNSYALSVYVKELLEHGQKFSVLNLTFCNVNLLEAQREYTEEMLRGVLECVKRQKGILAFKNMSSGLLFVGEDVEQLCQAGEEILDFFIRDEEWYKEARLAVVQSGEAFSSNEEFFHFLNFLNLEYANEKEQVFVVNDNIIDQYRQKHVIEQKIAEALEEDRVEVFLQPIYSNRDKCFTSAEALVRIREDDGSLLSPGVFIPVAEESGQILELGERVFEKVCEFLQQIDPWTLGLRYIEVNLSVIQCERSDLAQRLIDIVKKYKVSPSLINLEITETASISARNTLLENMKMLMEYGFTFSLDDFGKGESNLMYVVEMPVSIVKLDFDMTKAYFKSPKAKHVVRAVVGMAHGMCLKLVAEGIETKEELAGMRREGIDYIQGYYYSKPLPMADFLSFIIANRRR